MKLTWFGGRTLRIHIGGEVVVWRPAAIAGLAPEELLSGADRVVTAGERLEPVEGASWRPRRTASELEAEGARPGLRLAALGAGVDLIEIPGEAPLLIVAGPLPAVGRWGREAVVVAFSAAAAISALERAGPRLIALALAPEELDAAFDRLRGDLGDTGLMALEPGLAVEV